jgi:predicted GIY-YIG superfamily endonuclease
MFCVYKLENNRGQVYFGKTNNPKERLKKHRYNSNKCTSQVLWQDDGIVDDIEVLDWFETEELALQRETELIRNNNCVNLLGNRGTKQEQNKAYRENNKEKLSADSKAYREKNKEIKIAYQKEYYEKNKEKINANQKEYEEKNKERISARRREKIVCDICCSVIARGDKAKHQRTAKCKSFSECG